MSKRKTKTEITPGPYSVHVGSYGCEVSGINGVQVAWCGQAVVFGEPSHSIDSDEARANAEAIAAALTKIWEGKGNG